MKRVSEFEFAKDYAASAHHPLHIDQQILAAKTLFAYPEHIQVAALLDGITTNTDASLEDLRRLDFDPRAIHIVAILARSAGHETEESACRRINLSRNRDAIRVKHAQIAVKRLCGERNASAGWDMCLKLLLAPPTGFKTKGLERS
jgi:hypothetical protein